MQTKPTNVQPSQDALALTTEWHMVPYSEYNAGTSCSAPAEGVIQEDLLLRDRKSYIEKVNRLKENYPQIIPSAAKYLKDAIKEKYGLYP